MTGYHVTADGTMGKCEAHYRKCPLATAFTRHFDTEAEAQAFNQAVLERKEFDNGLLEQIKDDGRREVMADLFLPALRMEHAKIAVAREKCQRKFQKMIDTIDSGGKITGKQILKFRDEAYDCEHLQRRVDEDAEKIYEKYFPESKQEAEDKGRRKRGAVAQKPQRVDTVIMYDQKKSKYSKRFVSHHEEPKKFQEIIDDYVDVAVTGDDEFEDGFSAFAIGTGTIGKKVKVEPVSNFSIY